MDRPHAIVIGAGFTGVATAHDLALRGFAVTVVERGPIANGTSGRTHGLLHSGARYAVTDPESARECIQENAILRRIVPEAIEPNGGLFVALTEEDLAYREAFIRGCEACGIPLDELTPQEALRLEPHLNPRLLTAFRVPDGTFDPLRLALAFAATARANGARFRTYTEVEGMVTDGQGRVVGVRVWDRRTGERGEIRGEVVVNAAGVWAGRIAALVGARVPVRPTAGVMVAFDRRLVQRAINRLNTPGDGDIALPQRRMVVVGTTSYAVDDPDYIPVRRDHVAQMVARGAELIPGLRQARVRAKFASARPLVGAGGRSASRTFKCFDHEETDGIPGLVTITGGKATTMRAMAEAVSDLVCRKLGVRAACATRETPLLSYRRYFAP